MTREDYINILELDKAELTKENQELKKQLEEYKDKINWYENFEVNKTIDKLRLKHNTQQKKFINYLQEELNVQIQQESIGCETTNKRYILEEILQKYKEIIETDNL